MSRKLSDPPEVKKYAKRGDPPIEQWPGRVVTREDLMAASGDPRDWFRYGHRLKAYEQAWMEFADARRRRKDFTSGFSWNQMLVLGDYGTGKTTLAIHLARHFFGLGHAVFSNASCLFGWHLEREEMYTAMGQMPKNSVLLIDKSPATLTSRIGHGVAVGSFSEMNLRNTRKQNCIVVYVSDQDWEIAPAIRRNCREVWMPVPKEDLEVADSPASTGERLEPANNPGNFRLAWHVWDDYPYRKANLIEGPDADHAAGFGPPTYTMYDGGENVRRAMLLNDTFEPAQAGAATMPDRDTIKKDLGDFLGRSSRRRDNLEEMKLKLLAYFRKREQDPPEFFKAGELAQVLGVSASVAGRVLQEWIPVSSVRRRGYRSSEVYGYIYGQSD